VEYEVRDGEVVYKDGGPVRVMVTEEHLGPTTEPTLRDLSEALIAVYGTDYGIHSPTWISKFTDMTRQAASYRDRRVLLAGDAAHVHAPDGGQGLNTGVQDAVNLGWKLAQVVKGISPESLLDTYHAERHPVGARVLRNTMAQIALRRADERTKALRDIFGLSIVGTLGWVVALVGAAMALRRAGASLGPFILLIFAGVFLLGGHPYPAGTLAFGSFFLAAAWLELAPERLTSARGF
jgi:2-polyprenyl-6-methoxyphenol hydroxylase-like FAD-dependent oxidoreductase